MNLRKYFVPEFVVGDNSLGLVGRYAQNFAAKKVLLVTDHNIIKAGWVEVVEESLKASNIPYVIFDKPTPNPKDYEVEEGALLFKSEHCDIIIAIGGGSVIDCAKGIGIVCSNHKHINEFEGVDKVSIPIPPLICIPTTAGSSADISQFAIILNTKEQRKIAIISKTIVPDIALIDALPTTTMPIEETVATGIDALVHAFEAYVSNASSPITDMNAIKAIQLISGNLLKVVSEPNNLVYRNNVSLGSLLAGMAFSNASLGLVHAMAHSLGGLLDAPHGECNALLLEHCVDYNFDSCPERYRDVYEALHNSTVVGKEDVKENLLKYIIDFRNSCKVEFGREELSAEVLKQLAINAYNDPCLATNPKEITVEQIVKLYERIF